MGLNVWLGSAVDLPYLMAYVGVGGNRRATLIAAHIPRFEHSLGCRQRRPWHMSELKKWTGRIVDPSVRAIRD
jgi:hypothetical protein